VRATCRLASVASNRARGVSGTLRAGDRDLPELGDGVLHRTIVRVQKLYFDPPDLDGRMPRVSKWGP
jgi:hypothetical protein